MRRKADGEEAPGTIEGAVASEFWWVSWAERARALARKKKCPKGTCAALAKIREKR